MSCEGNADLVDALRSDDVGRVEALLGSPNGLQSLMQAAQSGSVSLSCVRSTAMADKLIEHGVGVNLISRMWASGFGLNPEVDPAIGRHLISRGVTATPHVAAALGLTDILKQLLDADPKAVHAKGGDGCTPLHFARDRATADLLIEHGANLDARDDDHESTPAQWLIGDSPDVAAHLLSRGATPDIFLAAALGDRRLVESLIHADRHCLSHRIGKSPFHPIGHNGRGGTILQWKVGFNCYPHQVAFRKGHRELFDFMFAASDATTQFLVACVMANRPVAEALCAANPDLVQSLPDVDKELVARYCWETNVDLEAVRLMLDVGFPVDFPERSHGYTPLHNAAWGGYADVVDLLISRGHPVALRDPSFSGTPLDWALHCCLTEKRHPEGQYHRVLSSLLSAGCPLDPKIYPTNNPALDEVLRKYVPSQS